MIINILLDEETAKQNAWIAGSKRKEGEKADKSKGFFAIILTLVVIIKLH